MRQILKFFDYSCIVIIFLLVLVPPAIFVLPFSQPTRNKLINPFWKLFSYLILRVVMKTKMTIYDRRRVKNQTEGLYILNHQSMVDIPFFSYNHQIPPIMKHEILYIPVFGLVGLVSGAITVKRKDPNSRKQTFLKAQARLKSNLPVQYYPEGTRSKTDHPKPYEDIYKTLMDYCYGEKIQVIPCSMFGTKKVLRQDGSANYGTKIGIITHPEMDPRQYNSKEEFSRACWNQVLTGYSELEKELTVAGN